MNNILTKFAGVYGGPLNPDEEREVGAFAVQLLKAAVSNDGAAIADLIKAAAAQITVIDDYEALMGMLEHIEKEGAFNYQKALMFGLPIVAAGLSAVPAITSAVQGMGRRSKIDMSRTQILREHPALQDDADFDRYFDTVKRFAPDVAADPLVAGNIMIEMHRLGPAAMTPTRINELLGLQGRMGDMHGIIPGQVAQIGTGINTALGTYGKTVGLDDPQTAMKRKELSYMRLQSDLKKERELNPTPGMGVQRS